MSDPNSGPEPTVNCLAPGGVTGETVASWVREFHQVFGLPVAEAPTADVPAELRRLRRTLLCEEVREVCEAIDAGDVVKIADALADLAYVVYGTALTFGIDLDEVVAVVHRANMTKLGPEGRPIMREDGKILKGPGYLPPDIEAVLEHQRIVTE